MRFLNLSRQCRDASPTWRRIDPQDCRAGGLMPPRWSFECPCSPVSGKIRLFSIPHVRR
jgi:hypothetical protein